MYRNYLKQRKYIVNSLLKERHVHRKYLQQIRQIYRCTRVQHTGLVVIILETNWLSAGGVVNIKPAACDFPELCCQRHARFLERIAVG